MVTHESLRAVSRRLILGGTVAAPVSMLSSPPAQALSHASKVAARQRVFGAVNVDKRTGKVNPSKTVLSWIGVSGFAMAFRGKVALLDAWVPRGLTSGYVPTTPRQLAQLEPEAIFIGHGHFDHAGDAAQIAAASGAVVVGTPQQCEQIRGQAMPGQRIQTRPVGDEADEPGTRYDVKIAGIDISVMAHVHSAPKLPDLKDPSRPLFTVPGLCSLVKYHPTLKDMRHLGSHLTDSEGGTLLYQFRGGSTSITWHDSSGPIPESAPGLEEDLRGLPATTVQVGAVQGFNQYTNGLRDPRMYMGALRPRVFVPTHHDNWMPLITTHGSAYERPLATEIARLPPASRPELRFLRDPQDYLNPARLTF